jgi:hypothetical protein
MATTTVKAVDVLLVVEVENQKAKVAVVLLLLP